MLHIEGLIRLIIHYFFLRIVGELVSQYSFRKEEKSDFSPAFLNKFRILKALLESGVDLGCQFLVGVEHHHTIKFSF